MQFPVVKTKLSWKLFGVLMLNAALLVTVLVLTLHHIVSQDFQEYVRESERERFHLAKASFEDFYARFQSWDLLADNPRLWRDLIRDRMVIHHEAMMGRGANERLLPKRQSQRERNIAGFQRGRVPIRKPDIVKKNKAPELTEMPAGPRRGTGTGPALLPNRTLSIKQPPVHVPVRPRLRGLPFEGRLLIFDQSGRLLLGFQRKTPPELMETMHYQGQTIGRLGMYIPDAMPNPRDQLFLSTLNRMLWIVAGLMVGLAVLFSLGLSWYLLRPVRRLTEGTHALAERRFETRVSITTTDELGQLARDFNSMAETLEQFEQQRKQWLSDISHELGTPLSVMRGEIEALQDGVRIPSAERLASLHAEVMQLNRIVEDLKLLNRAESGRLDMQEFPFNPVRLLNDTLAQYEERFSAREITITNKLDLYGDRNVLGDQDRLRQVFANLLGNVLRYVDCPGNLTVQSKLEAGKITLIFSDSGPGVPEKMLPHLFDRFFRVDNSRNRSTGGSGLGLAICKNLIEAHKGEIHASRVSPQGLRINIQLPLIPEYQNER